MSRHPPVTEQEVKDAIYTCLSNAQAPSADRLLSLIGHGSKTTVLKLRDALLENMRAGLSGQAFPQDLPEALVEPVRAIWAHARDYAASLLAEERTQAQHCVERAEQERSAALEAARVADSLRQQTQALVDERAKHIDELNSALDRERKICADQAREHAWQIDAMRATHASAIEQARERADIQIDGLRQQVDQAQTMIEQLRIEQAREREYWNGQEQQYVRMADEARVERDALKQKLKSQEQWAAIEMSKLRDSLRENLNVAARAESLLKVTQEELERVRDEASALSQRLAEQKALAECAAQRHGSFTPQAE